MSEFKQVIEAPAAVAYLLARHHILPLSPSPSPLLLLLTSLLLLPPASRLLLALLLPLPRARLVIVVHRVSL